MNNETENTKTEIKIEKGIPVPKDLRTVKKYPVAELEVGDSFFVPNMTSASLGGTTSYYARKHNRKFTIRNEGTGCRVWRVA